MARSSSSEVSQLLQAWNDGDETALEKLMPLVYNELHRMARHYMARESPGHTLQTTALVNEAYVRLVDSAHNNFRLHHQFASAIQNSDGDHCLVHIQPNILGIIHEGAPSCCRW